MLESVARLLVPGSGARIVDAPLEIEPYTLFMVWHRDRSQDPANAWLRATIKDVAARMA